MFATALKKIISGVQNMIPAVRTGKEKILAEAAKQALLSKSRGALVLTQFSVDTKGRTLLLEIVPQGEESGISVEIIGYSISSDNGGYVFEFDALRVSKEWVTTLLKEFIPTIMSEKKLAIPQRHNQLFKVAKLLLD